MHEHSKPAIVVTGASSGIGREIAKVAARDNQPLLLIARNELKLNAIADELRSGGTSVFVLAVDLSSPDSFQRIEQALTSHNLHCDVLVNNAGFGVFGAATEIDAASAINVIDVNVRALTELTLKFLPGMVARRRGGILNAGSITGFFIGPYMATYYASKAYIRSFSLALASELEGSGVTMTCLAPGVVLTPFFDRCAVGKTRLFKIMPRTNVAVVAEAGWRGFRAGQALVIPNFANRAILALTSLLPSRAVTALIRRLQQPPGLPDRD